MKAIQYLVGLWCFAVKSTQQKASIVNSSVTTRVDVPSSTQGIHFCSPVQPQHLGKQGHPPLGRRTLTVPRLCEMCLTPFLIPSAVTISLHVPTACAAVCSVLLLVTYFLFLFSSFFFFASYRWTKEEEVIKKETGLFRKGEEQRQR